MDYNMNNNPIGLVLNHSCSSLRQPSGIWHRIMLKVLLLLLLVLLLHTHTHSNSSTSHLHLSSYSSSSASVSASASEPGPAPSLKKQLQDACSKDLSRPDGLCASTSDEGMSWQLFCLYSQSREALSESCQSYLGSTTLGGCNDEARSLCAEQTTVEDILTCLEEHKDELGTDCLRNIENKAKKDSPMKQMEDAIMLSTKRVTRVGVVFLAVPLLLAAYAFYWVHVVLYREQNSVLSESATVWKANSEVVRPDDDDVVEQQLQHNSASQLQSSRGPWCLSFHQLNYWAVGRKSWREPFTVVKKKILCDVSGQIQACKVTAIMGPSGSGKTTLLKLLGGHMYNGEFTGSRSINKCIPERKAYDEIMRRQGFVAQHDCLLSTLTVWQTLMFAALLRLPQEMSINKKIHRAAFIMNDVGLTHIAHSFVGDHNGNHGGGNAGQSAKCISGGQRRRLSIALELLASPSTILLDEPTSGLDGASTLKIVTSLRDMSRAYLTTICLTIHQPRAEVFDLFDCLLLLGAEGHVVYYGPTNTAAHVLSSAPFLQGKSFSFDNPGDFIIDLLGLDDSEEDLRSNLTSSDIDQTVVNSPLHSTSDTEGSRNRTELLADHFSTTTNAHELLRELMAIFEREEPVESNRSSLSSLSGTINSFFTPSQYSRIRRSESTHGEMDIEMTSTASNSTINSFVIEDDSDETKAETLSTESIELPQLSQEESTAHNTRKCFRCSDYEYLRYKSTKRYHPTFFYQQVLAMFGRRYFAFSTSLSDLFYLVIQIIFVGIVVSKTFSYSVANELELPYQVLMLISLISLYAMILQYLILTPEYIIERQTIMNDCLAGFTSSSSYIWSVTLTEIPRAVFHSTLLMFILYEIHPLNPDAVRIKFAVVCLIIGVSAWQGLITICSVVTDSIGVAYSIVFLVLSSGTLFGGLLVRLEKIPSVFKIFYYISVAAVTQRALITNDMQCCYLTTTCNSIAIDLKSSENQHQASVIGDSNSTTTFCPPGLEFTGDGSDIGNVGRFYLMGLGLEEDHPFISLLFLCVTNVLFRVIAVLILKYRLSTKDCLQKFEN